MIQGRGVFQFQAVTQSWTQNHSHTYAQSIVWGLIPVFGNTVMYSEFWNLWMIHWRWNEDKETRHIFSPFLGPLSFDFCVLPLFIFLFSSPCVSPSLHISLSPSSLSDNWGKSHRPLAVPVTVPFSIPSVTILAQQSVKTANKWLFIHCRSFPANVCPG